MHGPLLALLTTLFACRVFGQALVAFFGVTWLPPMQQWFSGVIPYPSLLIIQLLMLLLMIKITGDIWRGKAPSPSCAPLVQLSHQIQRHLRRSHGLSLYPDMILRPEMRWFGDIIPIIFHFVLAGFILSSATITR